MNDYAQFKQAVKNRVLEFMPDQYQMAEVTIEKVLKNNDEERDRLSIRKGEQILAPAVYLKSYYDEMILARVSEEEAIKWIAQDYVMYDRDIGRNFQESWKEDLLDYDKVKDRIQIQLISTEQNEKLLKGTVHKKLENMDLAAVFRIHFDEIPIAPASMLITEYLLENWRTDVETLYNDALENSVKKFPYTFMDMMQLIPPSVNSHMSGQIPDKETEPLYLFSNTKGQYGASVLLYPEVIQTLARELQSDFFILPSSVHELVLVKDNGRWDIQELQRMLMDINRSTVPPEERLSDQVYYYDREDQSLSMVTTPEGTRKLIQEFFQDDCGQNNLWEEGVYAEPEMERE